MRQSGVKVVTDYAGSEVLLSKIKLIQKGDVYLPGDRHYVDQAAAAGFVHLRKPVFYWVPTILVRKGNPKGISGLKDLLRSDVKVGVGDPKSCATGRSSKKVFEKNGIAWEQVEKNLTFQSQTVNELGMQIQAGSLDAVVVWDAVAKYYSEHGEMVDIPVEQNIISSVDVAVLSFSENRRLAEEFLAFLTSERGRGVFEGNNYRTKAPK
jgi:molybdate transport system substrate-binding protein